MYKYGILGLCFYYISTKDNSEYILAIQDTCFGFGVTLSTILNNFDLFCVFPVSCIKLTMHAKICGKYLRF